MKLRLYKSKKTIYGCSERGDGDSPYLTRYILLETRYGELKLHQFHRSDGEVQHSHPWNFCSLILWPGYWEVTPSGTKRRWPLVPAYRPAEWQHRVQLLTGCCWTCLGTGDDFFYNAPCPVCQGSGRQERSCWTLIWTGPKFRRWGFFTPAGYRDSADYFRENGC